MPNNLPCCPCCGAEATYRETTYHFKGIKTAIVQCNDCGLSITHCGPAEKIADTRAKVMAAWMCRIPQHKPCLIVSQYYYSRYCYFVAYDPETFLAQARACIEDLERHKRQWDDLRPIRYGDLENRWYCPGSLRHNVNDDGDIYFIVGDSVGELLPYVREYYDKVDREERQDRRKNIAKKIATHHDPGAIYAIVKSHFRLI
ncbi:hypothetical protein [Anaeromassilibacillus senegalensis]|uniref:hypothetical protein n=1 Tax=Anaeromassilibacillus senegalensis TaxID=1673717 RepID=UPI0006809E6B|nr:hypothetical protein [Anaeromassilibacillus senegalensis]